MNTLDFFSKWKPKNHRIWSEWEEHEQQREFMKDLESLQLSFIQPTARKSDPETSHMAAKDVKFRVSRHRAWVLQVLYIRPMIDHDLAWNLDLQHNSAGKRRGDLCKAGLAEPLLSENGDPVRLQAPSGSKAQVWCLTEKGYRYVEDHLLEWGEKGWKIIYMDPTSGERRIMK